MRVLSTLLVALGLLIGSFASTAMHVLSNLGDVDFVLDPLVRGDLRPLFASATFAAALPSACHPSLLFAFAPGALMVTIAAVLLAVARRWPGLQANWLAAIMLFAAALPYAVGALMLRGNVVAEAAGPWLLCMLVGPFYAVLLSWAFLLRGLWLDRRRAPRAAAALAPA
ncbi:MAG: hypothetical protein JNN13_11040 [Planctomycetes bacterium]|nr:hypothetical protein [Planctomycetota bacterium]